MPPPQNTAAALAGPTATEIWDLLVEHVLQRSGQGPYSNLANAMAEFSRSIQETPDACAPPSVIADTISKAVKTDRPKIRYVVGPGAGRLIFLRKWFGDRFYDSGMARVYGV